MSRVNPNVHSFLRENGYLLARGGSPFDSRTRRPYDPLRDSPLHVPSFGISDGQLKEQPDLFFSLAEQAKNGKIVSFTFHGVPDEEHPGVGTGQEKFKELMEYLKKNRYNVIALRDVAEYVDVTKAALCLSRSTQYPWGGSSLLTGARVNRKGSTLYIGIEELPADRKLTLLNMTTKIERAWFLADPEKKAIPVETAFNGISTITVPEFSPDRYGESPVIIAAQLQGGPIATILDFCLSRPAGGDVLRGRDPRRRSGGHRSQIARASLQDRLANRSRASPHPVKRSILPNRRPTPLLPQMERAGPTA